MLTDVYSIYKPRRKRGGRGRVPRAGLYTGIKAVYTNLRLVFIPIQFRYGRI
jgi:hypothetical protein